MRTALLLFIVLIAVRTALGQEAHPDDVHWSSRFSPPLVEHVVDVEADDGDVYLLGIFRIGTDLPYGILHVDAATGEHELIGQRLPRADRPGDGISDIAVTPSRVIVAGDFDLGFGGRFVAAWDRGRHAWEPAFPDHDSQIFLLATDEETVYGVMRTNVDSRWQSSVVELLGDEWVQLDGTLPGSVDVMVAGGGALYAAFRSYNAQGLPHDHTLVRWEGSEWKQIGHVVAATVRDLAIDSSGDLIAVGSFTQIDGVQTGTIARWDGDGWRRAGIDPITAPSVSSVAATEDGLIFITPESLGGIARLEDGYWSRLPVRPDRVATRLAAGGGRLHASGAFDLLGDGVSPRLATWEESEARWKATVSQQQRGVGGLVRSIVIGPDGDVYVAGSFVYAGDVAARGVARWDDEAWHPVGDGLVGTTESLIWHGGLLWAGGHVAATPDGERVGVARWDPAAGEWTDAAGEAALRLTSVSGMTTFRGALVAVGSAEVSDGTDIGGVFAYAGGAWSMIAEARWGTRRGYLSRTAGGEDFLYIAGDFDRIEGVEANGLARWDGEAWAGLAGVNGSNVSAMAVADGRLVTGTYADDTLRVWSPAEDRWTSTSAGLSTWASCTRAIYAITQVGSRIVVGGGTGICITKAPDEVGPEQGIRVWDGEGWSTPGSGIGGTVRALAKRGDDLFVGGRFDRAGSHASFNFARWDAAEELPAVDDPHRPSLAAGPAFPNPFGGSTTIPVELPLSGYVRASVHNVLGQEVAVLLDAHVGAGRHELTLTAEGLAPGLYVCTVDAAGRRVSTLMMLVR